MTRKQAEKIADKICDLARVAGAGNPSWTSVDVALPRDLVTKLDENPSLVVGCMPMGWRVTGPLGATTVTVIRRTA